MAKRFAAGERIRFPAEWPPESAQANYSIPAGSAGTVVMAPNGPSEIYVVHLDTPHPQWGREMNCMGSDIEPE